MQKWIGKDLNFWLTLLFFTANLAFLADRCISAFNFILGEEKRYCSHLFAGTGDSND